MGWYQPALATFLVRFLSVAARSFAWHQTDRPVRRFVRILLYCAANGPGAQPGRDEVGGCDSTPGAAITN